MAYAVCSNILKDIGVACNQKATAGFTGRGLLIPKEGLVVTRSAAGDIINITSDQAEMVLVDNVWANAFDGTQVQMNTDNGRPMWHRDFVVRVPRVGDGIDTRNTVKALARASVAGIFEREDGTYLAVGFDGKMIATAETQAENANGGDWAVTLGSDESNPEVLFVDTPAAGSDPAVTAASKFQEWWESLTE